jgi:hypothetical protein
MWLRIGLDEGSRDRLLRTRYGLRQLGCGLVATCILRHARHCSAMRTRTRAIMPGQVDDQERSWRPAIRGLICSAQAAYGLWAL